jgi:hypothetical protein
LQTGTYISGAGHIGLITWVLFGGVFASEPDPFEVTEVSVITAEQFAGLVAAQQSPVTAPEPVALVQPDVSVQAPEVAATPDPEPDRAQPEAAEQPKPETPPDASSLVPLPDAEVTETTPTLEQPAEDVAVLVTPVPRPRPRPAERVAPKAVAAPPPDAAPAEVEQEAVKPDNGAETPRPPQEETAPEEATTEIVTEAEQTAARAPTRSVRPPSRPSRPAKAPTDTVDTAAAVNSALSEALAEIPRAPAAPSGPPMSAGEKDALRVAVSGCWNVGSLSSEALGTTVIVSVAMSQDARPSIPSIRMLSFSGGSEAAAGQAFEAARRAIIRCGARGYDLPPEKYDHWRDIEMTFNPERMRIK